MTTKIENQLETIQDELKVMKGKLTYLQNLSDRMFYLIFRNVILKEFCKSGSEPDIECRKKLALRLESIEERYRYAIGGILKAIYQMEMETISNR